MRVVRAVSGFSKADDSLVWETEVGDDVVAEVGAASDTSGDPEMYNAYPLEGELLRKVSRIAGFEIDADLDYLLETYTQG
ncbi:hypothetical protein HDA32_004305 [Spinactinospora alkalitolerans]|uniref:DUF7683 domain-containing protein n=1 Tax=Spinactinospora alkalitolerans TaxID=687207 RepID=A0A852U0X9_9ACTN|nr:hypothetical protein [Spinactinospora alkalitolerans]NYE49185.1 hypothetical protein [Spinactinospora alkalitolerans]